MSKSEEDEDEEDEDDVEAEELSGDNDDSTQRHHSARAGLTVSKWKSASAKASEKASSLVLDDERRGEADEGAEEDEVVDEEEVEEVEDELGRGRLGALGNTGKNTCGTSRTSTSSDRRLGDKLRYSDTSWYKDGATDMWDFVRLI